MKAIIKKGKELLDSVYISDTSIIINTTDKWLFSGKEVSNMKKGLLDNFKFKKGRLLLTFKNIENYREVPENSIIEIAFSGEVTSCEIDDIEKDQIYFNITT